MTPIYQNAKDYCVTCHAVETELRAKIAKIEAQRRLIEVLESDVEKAMAERDELQSKNAKLREQLAEAKRLLRNVTQAHENDLYFRTDEAHEWLTVNDNTA